MKEFSMPVILQLAGVLIIIAEIFLPSGGLLSLVAAGLFGYSLFIVFNDISTMAGTYFVLADLFIIPILVAGGLKILAHSPATLRNTLSSASGVVSQAPVLENFMGCGGKSLTDLHPGGTAIIADQVQRRAWAAIAVAHCMKRAGNGDVVQIMTCGMRQRARLAPACHAAVNQFGIAGHAFIRTQAQAFHDTR